MSFVHASLVIRTFLFFLGGVGRGEGLVIDYKMSYRQKIAPKLKCELESNITTNLSAALTPIMSLFVWSPHG